MTVGKVRVSVWVNPELWFLAKQDSLSFSALMDEMLSTLYNVDPDPELNRFLEQKGKMKKKVLEIYGDKLKAREHEKVRQDTENKKTLERMNLLKSLGEVLVNSRHKKDLLLDLENRSLDKEMIWDLFSFEVKKKLNLSWSPTTVYNESLEWFRIYGGVKG